MKPLEFRTMMTHERFVQAVADIVASRAAPDDAKAIRSVKLVYGAGETGLRGVTYYQRWKAGSETVPFVEVCAFGQESWVQLAGTTIHELAHVVAGWNAGHSKTWKETAARLGLRNAKQAGHKYLLAGFDPDLRDAIAALPRPDDGAPVATLGTGSVGIGPSGLLATIKPCQAGVGTRGGKSRGTGSGSRLRKWACECPVIVRVASDRFMAHCDCCSEPFKRA